MHCNEFDLIRASPEKMKCPSVNLCLAPGLRREKEEKIIHEIIRLSGDCNINQENKNNLLQLQLELYRI